MKVKLFAWYQRKAGAYDCGDAEGLFDNGILVVVVNYAGLAWGKNSFRRKEGSGYTHQP